MSYFNNREPRTEQFLRELTKSQEDNQDLHDEIDREESGQSTEPDPEPWIAEVEAVFLKHQQEK